MRAIVMAAGSGGDVAPLAAVAGRLAARGCATTLLAPARYAAFAPRGVAFDSLGADQVFEAVFSGPAVWDARQGLAASWSYYGAAMRSSYPRLAQGWDARDTLIVSSSFALGARLAEELDGFCNTTVHLSPAILFSAEAPPRWSHLSVPAHWPLGLRRMLMRGMESVGTEPLLRPIVNGYRRELGLAPVRRILSQWLHSPASVAYAFPDWFAAPQSDWPRGRLTGFPLPPAHLGAALPPGLDDFLSAPCAVLTAGTAVAGQIGWLEQAIAAVQARGWRALVVGPGPAQRTAQLWRLPFVDFEHVLPRARCLIHHAGIGSAAAALRAGIAQLLHPGAHDQPDNAWRLEQLGLARVVRADWDAALAWAEQAAPAIAPWRQRLAAEADGADRIADLAIAHFEKTGT